MDARDKTARALIDGLVREGIVKADLDHLLALEALLRAAETQRWSGDELAAAVASLYATTPETWALIEQRCKAMFSGKLQGAPDKPVFVAFRAPTRRARARALLRRTIHWFAGLSLAGKLMALGIVLLGVAIAIGAPTAKLAIDEWVGGGEATDPFRDSAQPKDASADYVPILDPGVTEPIVVEPLLVPIYDEAVPADVRGETKLSSGSLFVLGLVLVVSGLSAGFGLTCSSVSRRYRAQLGVQRELAKLERKRLAEHPGAIEVLHRVERFPPFPEAAMDDIASILAAIGTAERSVELDVDRTLDRTVAAAGRPVPVPATRMKARELLVLVDIELGDHPFASGVDWLLDRWRRLGLAFVRYDFDHRPDARLQSWPERLPTSFSALLRRTHDMPLLLFSRNVALTTEHDEYARPARWLDSASAWPERLFVDLDPRVPHERDATEQRALARLAEHGFVRVPFTPEGLEFGAQVLAGRQRGDAPPERPLAPLIEVAEHVERWLAAVACVPDATWDQLEAFRRQLPELERALPEQRYVQRALEWIETELILRQVADSTLEDGGRRLAIGRFADELIAAQNQRDRAQQVPEAERLVNRARRLLLAQLDAAALHPSDPSYTMWSLKRAFHRALLEPARADQLLHGFLGGPHELELVRMLDAARLRQELLAGDGPQQLSARVRGRLHGRSRVSLATLWPSSSMLLAGLGTIPMIAGIWFAFSRPQVHATGGLDRRLIQVDQGVCDFHERPTPAEPTSALQAPPRGRVCGFVDTALADTDAPMRLIGVSDGEFTMGEAPGKFAEQALHRVALSRFALCETEVSVRQYELITGERPNDCTYGCADDQPVSSVSWEQAVRYLNSLTEYENRRRPATAQLTLCYDDAGRWDRLCTGYRLPSEAEWEYAARAGTTTTYYFGNDENLACRMVNCAGDDGGGSLVPVMSPVLPNPWGFHGIAGNVAEYVYDAMAPYEPTYYEGMSAVNPVSKAWLFTDNRVIRGGHYDNTKTGVRVARREQVNLKAAERWHGFRCARSMVPFTVGSRELCMHSLKLRQNEAGLAACVTAVENAKAQLNLDEYRQAAACVMAASLPDDLEKCSSLRLLQKTKYSL